jgi:hypothetical protein
MHWLDKWENERNDKEQTLWLECQLSKLIEEQSNLEFQLKTINYKIDKIRQAIASINNDKS